MRFFQLIAVTILVLTIMSLLALYQGISLTLIFGILASD